MLRRSWSVNGDFHFRSDLTQTVQSELEVDFAEAVVRAFFSLVELLNGLLEKVAREGYSRSLLKKLAQEAYSKVGQAVVGRRDTSARAVSEGVRAALKITLVATCN